MKLLLAAEQHGRFVNILKAQSCSTVDFLDLVRHCNKLPQRHTWQCDLDSYKHIPFLISHPDQTFIWFFLIDVLVAGFYMFPFRYTPEAYIAV